jgi:hypothetical protein
MHSPNIKMYQLCLGYCQLDFYLTGAPDMLIVMTDEKVNVAPYFERKGTPWCEKLLLA